MCHNQIQKQQKDKNNIKRETRNKIKHELRQSREKHTITNTKEKCRDTSEDRYSVDVIASGGLLDTIAAIQSGLQPIWGSETNQTMQNMWTDLTGTDNYGDATNIDYKAIRRPRVLKTGFPCQDYSELGNDEGQRTERGELYVKQGDIINQIKPDVAIIEQTNGILRDKHKQAVQSLIQKYKFNFTYIYIFYEIKT